MDFSLVPSPSSEYNKQRTEAHFNVHSFNFPTNNLTRRSGVRRPKCFEEENKQSTEEAGERARYRALTSTNGIEKIDDHTLDGYRWGGNHSGVKGQCEDMSASRMSTKPNRNGSAFATDRSETCNPPSESRGRTVWRRYNLPSRSKSLDIRSGKTSPERGKTADISMVSTKGGGDNSKEAGGLEERRTVVEGTRPRPISSILPRDSTGTSNDSQEREPLSRTLDRTSRGQSFPLRLRSTSGPSSDFSRTASSFGPKGGQSILERIEKLYVSAGFDKRNSGDFSPPLLSHHKLTTEFNSPEQLSQERTGGGTFPRHFSSGRTHNLSPSQNRETFPWAQKEPSETHNSRGSLSLGFWQGHTKDRYLEEREVSLSTAFEQTGTRSLDRTRSRCTAAEIKSERTTGQITAPLGPNKLFEKGRSVSLRDLSVLRETGTNGNKDEGRETHGKIETNEANKTVKERTGWRKEQEREKETNEAKEKSEFRSTSFDEDVFTDSSPVKSPVSTTERNKLPQTWSIPSVASVKNKISQFEALTQRSQGLASGEVLLARRAFSVPSQLNSGHDGIKKSSSVKTISDLKDKWKGLKEDKEEWEKKRKTATLFDTDLGSGRSFSVNDLGLQSVPGRNALLKTEGEQPDSGNHSAEEPDKYPNAKITLETPLNRGPQRLHINQCTDEIDSSKFSTSKEVRKRPSLLLFNSSDDSADVLKRTPSPVSDEDKTPTNTPINLLPLSFTDQLEDSTSTGDSENQSASEPTEVVKTPEQESPPFPHPSNALSPSNHPDPISPGVKSPNSKWNKPVLDLDAWLAGVNAIIKVGNDDRFEDDDDDESTQKDDDSNYDSDSGESSVTIISNMSQLDRRSFSVRWVVRCLMEVFLPQVNYLLTFVHPLCRLSDLCHFSGDDYNMENDTDEWHSIAGRSASLSSDMSAFSCVSMLPTEELDKLLADVRSLGDSKLQVQTAASFHRHLNCI